MLAMLALVVAADGLAVASLAVENLDAPEGIDGRLAVDSLAVDHLVAPEGIDVTVPRFSWHLVPLRRRATF